MFLTQNLKDTGYSKCVGQDDAHLKISVSQNGSPSINGIGFNLGDKIARIKNQQTFSAVYAIDENEWNGTISLQLKLKDIK